MSFLHFLVRSYYHADFSVVKKYAISTGGREREEVMEKKRMRNYVISSYLVFWAMVLGICGTASILRLFLAALLTMGATVSTVFILSLIQGKPFGSYWALGAYPLWASFLFSVTTGPTGEEAGWRGYVRSYLNKKYSFYKASIFQGLIWSFWHTVLWFVDSDFLGWDMIPYVLSNVIVMTALCFLINTFMEGNDNLLYGIVIHFCFNILYCFLQVDIWFYVVLIVVYGLIAGVICVRRKYLNLDEKNVHKMLNRN